MYATKKFVVPLGMDRLNCPELSVCAVKLPEPTFVATTVGVAPSNVKVTVVGLLLPVGPEPLELLEPVEPPPHPEINTRTNAGINVRKSLETKEVPFFYATWVNETGVRPAQSTAPPGFFPPELSFTESRAASMRPQPVQSPPGAWCSACFRGCGRYPAAAPEHRSGPPTP